MARRSVASRAWAPFLAPLLVLALLVCHGSLGGSDRLVLQPALPADALAEAAEAGTFHGHPVEHSDGHPVEHWVGHSLGNSTQDDSHSHAAVTATLFLILLGYALIALLRPSRGGAGLPGATLPAYARAPRLTARPHAPPLLQVFRL